MKEQPRHIDLDGGGSKHVKDLCESCQHSWIPEGAEGRYLKKCIYSGCFMDAHIDIIDCNRYLKEGHKGKVTYHDSKYEDYYKKVMAGD
jgi:hypothetical protein